MEHRFHPRRDLQTEVMLYHHGEAVAICTTRNISLSGVFIHTAPLHFCKHLSLEIELCTPRLAPVRGRRLTAFVVQVQGEGTGLMFRQLPDWAHRLVGTLLLESTPLTHPYGPHPIMPTPPILLLSH